MGDAGRAEDGCATDRGTGRTSAAAGARTARNRRGRGAVQKLFRERLCRHGDGRSGRRVHTSEPYHLRDAGLCGTGAAVPEFSGDHPPGRPGVRSGPRAPAARQGGGFFPDRKSLHRQGRVYRLGFAQRLCGARLGGRTALLHRADTGHHRPQVGRTGAARKRGEIPRSVRQHERWGSHLRGGRRRAGLRD